MANREELGIIRGARAGDAQCQLALGKLYLFGGASLPRSMPTALHWLNRAALQQQDEAWMLIGRYIPYEHARHCHAAVLPWYDRAYDAGVARAGLVLARLVLEQAPEQADARLRSKALDALADAARTGSSEARTLLAQQAERWPRPGGAVYGMPAAGLAVCGAAPASHQLSSAGSTGLELSSTGVSSPGRASPGHASPGHASPGYGSPGHGSPGHGSPGHAGQGYRSQGNASQGNASQGHAGFGLTGNGQASQGHTSPGLVYHESTSQAQALSARAGDVPYAALLRAWEKAGLRAYLPQAMPVVRELLRAAPPDAEAARALGWSADPQLLELLARCSAVLSALPQHDAELHQCRELAAYGGDRHAQLALGLWMARMRADGSRVPHAAASVNFKRAIRWLGLAAGQGLAEAWFALSRIYLKPEFSQRCVAEAQRHLERAAQLGHCAAQLECGLHAWRARRTEPDGDVRAAYWLQKAAAQGCDEAAGALARVAAVPQPQGWAAAAMGALSVDTAASQPLLAARLELAAALGLSRAEALLLDVKEADRGHCLVVDIRASYGRSKRRLILLGTARERQLLDRVQRRFEAAGGPERWEGNYRQRLYRLKTCLAA